MTLTNAKTILPPQPIESPCCGYFPSCMTVSESLMPSKKASHTNYMCGLWGRFADFGAWRQAVLDSKSLCLPHSHDYQSPRPTFSSFPKRSFVTCLTQLMYSNFPWAVEGNFVIQLGKWGQRGQEWLWMWQNCANLHLLTPVLGIRPHQILMASSPELDLWWIKASISSLPFFLF